MPEKNGAKFSSPSTLQYSNAPVLFPWGVHRLWACPPLMEGETSWQDLLQAVAPKATSQRSPYNWQASCLVWNLLQLIHTYKPHWNHVFKDLIQTSTLKMCQTEDSVSQLAGKRTDLGIWVAATILHLKQDHTYSSKQPHSTESQNIQTLYFQLRTL